MIKFYRNIEVNVIKKIDENNVLISIPLYEYTNSYNPEQYEPCSPDFMLQIVDKKYITDTKVELFKEYDKKIKEYKDEINKLNKDVSDIKKEYDRYNGEIDNNRKLFKELDVLFKFLDNKINYAVLSGWSEYQILPLKEAVKSNDKYFEKDIKLVSLLGDSKGNLQYKINQYRDGSGSWQSCWFFETENEAKEFVNNTVESEIKNHMKRFSLRELISMKEKYGIGGEIIDTEIEKLKVEKENNKIIKINELKEQIKKIEEEN